MVIRAIVLVGAAILASSGCLQKATSETWYLERDGRVAWVVDEADVRSDAQAVRDRQDEEQSYALAVRQEQHAMARGLRRLAPLTLKTTVLRDQAPFTVRTEARFRRLDELGQRMLEGIGLSGTSILHADGESLEWTFTIRDPKASVDPERVDTDVMELVTGLEGLRVVLVEGRFERGTGFELSSDHRVATMRSASDAGDEEPVVVMQLRWR